MKQKQKTKKKKESNKKEKQRKLREMKSTSWAVKGRENVDKNYERNVKQGKPRGIPHATWRPAAPPD